MYPFIHYHFNETNKTKSKFNWLELGETDKIYESNENNEKVNDDSCCTCSPFAWIGKIFGF